MSARLRWSLFFALCALAYLGFAYLMPRVDPKAGPVWKIDRPGAIAAARQLAAEKGVTVAAASSRWWKEVVFGEAHPADLQRYLKAHPGTTADRLQSLVPAVQAHVVLPSAEGDEHFEAWLDGEGRPCGFWRHFSRPLAPGPAAAPPDERTGAEAGARQRARTIARQLLDLKFHSEIPFALEESSENRDLPGQPVHAFTWTGHPPELPELKISARLAVRGETVVGDRLSLTLEDEDGLAPWQVASLVLLVLVALWAFIYASVRFVRRVREGEMSYSRVTLLAGAAFAALMIQMQVPIDNLTLQLVTQDVPPNLVVGLMIGLLLVLAFALFVVALLGAFIWTGLEGDVREVWPHKLTALDAVLSGRLLSRDLAWSTLVGIAFGGPVLAVLPLAHLLPGPEPVVDQELAILIGTRFPLATLLFNGTVAPLIAVTLLVVLSLLLRWIRPPKRTLMVLTVAYPVLFAVFRPAFSSEPALADVVMGLSAAAMVLVPFLICDLVATFWCVCVVNNVLLGLYLYHQPAEGLRTAATQGTGLAVLALGAILVLWRWGRTYAAEEVRPVYARNIAERRELMAERTLALEALARLLPATLPAVPGITLAASCRRGSGAGTDDYYDFFPLPEGRLGIAVVDLKDRGTASALRLALVKGLLKAFSRRQSSPEAVGEHLQARLAAAGEELYAALALVYAVYEPAARTLRYARRGEAPPILLRRRDGEGSPLDRGGTVTLQPGDAVILTSDGVLPEADASSLVDVVSRSEGEDASSLHDAIRQRIDAQRPATKVADRDDETLVVLAVDLEPEASS